MWCSILGLEWDSRSQPMHVPLLGVPNVCIFPNLVCMDSAHALVRKLQDGLTTEKEALGLDRAIRQLKALC